MKFFRTAVPPTTENHADPSPSAVIRDVAGFTVVFLAAQLGAAMALGVGIYLSGHDDDLYVVLQEPLFVQATALFSYGLFSLWLLWLWQRPAYRALFPQVTHASLALAGVGLILFLLLQAASHILLVEILGFPPVEDSNRLRTLPVEGAGLPLALMIVNVVLLAPILEEILFRGLIFARLNHHFSVKTSIIVSAALFALVHFDAKLFHLLFLLGVIAAFITHKSGSIRPAIALHLLNNLMAIIATLAFAGTAVG